MNGLHMPFDLGPGAVAFLALAVFVAAFIRGYSGFGFSALVVSASALVTNPLNFVPVVMMLEIAATAGQAPKAWRDVDKRLLGLLLFGAAAIMPFSIWLAASMNVEVLRLVIAVWVLVMCAGLVRGWHLKPTRSAPALLGVGGISGVANAAAMGGLPVALFLAAQNTRAATFRASMIFYLCAIDLIGLPLLGMNGLISVDTWLAAALSLPLLGVGVWLGGKRFLHAEPEGFRRMAIGLLAVLAILGLAKTLV